MPLKLKDLERHEKELMKIILDAQEELKALKTLKRRFGAKPKALAITPSPATVIASAEAPTIFIRTRGELTQAIQDEISKLGERWFSPKTIAVNIVRAGIRSELEWESLRATVSTTLRNMAQHGTLKRKDISESSKPVYEYKKNVGELPFK